ncbi:MAG: NADH-quinone oxidoreductase subunit N [Emticicia sp.]|nr:NADH-quinone oxidoreductase subunit N [Emticicia sp.]
MLEKLSHILFSSRVLLPDLLFGVVFLVIVAAIAFSQKLDTERTYVLFNVLIISVLISMCFVFYAFFGFYKQYFESGSVLFGQLIYLDSVSLFFKLIISVASVAVLIHVWVVGYKVVGEFYAIFMALVWGLFIMTMTTNWLMLYVSLEMVSICSYILVVFNKGKANSEAGIKYLLFGATSSAIMLYGISLLYGMTGTLNFVGQEFATFLGQNPTWIAQIAIFMAVGGLLFKLSAVPFHSWTPDVYEATPTPIVAFLSIAPKAAVVLVLIRLFSSLSIDFRMIMAVVIMASITIGNFSALWQTNTKRMLGYSTIAHAGFMLVGLLATNIIGIQASSFLYCNLSFYYACSIFIDRFISSKNRKLRTRKSARAGAGKYIFGFGGCYNYDCLSWFTSNRRFYWKIASFYCFVGILPNIRKQYATCCLDFWLAEYRHFDILLYQNPLFYDF